MSPNEFQLRAALSDGEGDVPDADRAITNAMRVRDERRRRITTIASSAAVVAVVVTGATLLTRGNGGEAGSGGGGGQSGPALGAVVPGQATHGGIPYPPAGVDRPGSSADTVHKDASNYGAEKKASGISCPAQFPRLALPGGGGTDQFGADGPLFSETPAAMKICSYPPDADSSVELDGDTARRLAATLEAAPTTGDPLACLASAPRLALYAVGSSGTVMRVVTAEPGCKAYLVTNGTAVRVVPLVSALAVLSVANDAAPSPNEGSPDK